MKNSEISKICWNIFNSCEIEMGSEYKRILCETTEISDSLMAGFTQEQKDKLIELSFKYAELEYESGDIRFFQGFKTAFLIAKEIYESIVSQ